MRSTSPRSITKRLVFELVCRVGVESEIISPNGHLIEDEIVKFEEVGLCGTTILDVVFMANISKIICSPRSTNLYFLHLVFLLRVITNSNTIDDLKMAVRNVEYAYAEYSSAYQGMCGD